MSFRTSSCFCESTQETAQDRDLFFLVTLSGSIPITKGTVYQRARKNTNRINLQYFISVLMKGNSEPVHASSLPPPKKEVIHLTDMQQL